MNDYDWMVGVCIIFEDDLFHPHSIILKHSSNEKEIRDFAKQVTKEDIVKTLKLVGWLEEDIKIDTWQVEIYHTE